MMYKFHSLTLAAGFRNRATKSMAILLGDDGLYWVVTLRAAEHLYAQGYEPAE